MVRMKNTTISNTNQRNSEIVNKALIISALTEKIIIKLNNH